MELTQQLDVTPRQVMQMVLLQMLWKWQFPLTLK
jgi:hypothetical protein